MKNNYVERTLRAVYAVQIKDLHTELMKDLSEKVNKDIGIQARLDDGLVTLHIGTDTKVVGYNDYLVIDFDGFHIYTYIEFNALFKSIYDGGSN